MNGWCSKVGRYEKTMHYLDGSVPICAGSHLGYTFGEFCARRADQKKCAICKRLLAKASEKAA